MDEYIVMEGENGTGEPDICGYCGEEISAGQGTEDDAGTMYCNGYCAIAAITE